MHLSPWNIGVSSCKNSCALAFSGIGSRIRFHQPLTTLSMPFCRTCDALIPSTVRLSIRK